MFKLITFSRIKELNDHDLRNQISLIIIFYVQIAERGFLPESTVAYGPMAKPEVSASLCPRTNNSTYGPQNMKYYFYYMLLFRQFEDFNILFLVSNDSIRFYCPWKQGMSNVICDVFFLRWYSSKIREKTLKSMLQSIFHINTLCHVHVRISKKYLEIRARAFQKISLNFPHPSLLPSPMGTNMLQFTSMA